jgi:hypothetical protein
LWARKRADAQIKKTDARMKKREETQGEGWRKQVKLDLLLLP